jgi:hypothetical protein
VDSDTAAIPAERKRGKNNDVQRTVAIRKQSPDAKPTDCGNVLTDGAGIGLA